MTATKGPSLSSVTRTAIATSQKADTDFHGGQFRGSEAGGLRTVDMR